ncbi:acetylxylan esterase [Arthrobacter jiangjiafuii]|uniref:Acetylxylan esterase n=1 Tax=Arthrobacter jiangjiafuii TaxID=2817475 RepID=A0A975M6W7_9MICC|nr:acetylxylan esterase [Arthrobacter jiangjiafuii]MBP3043735.1 acetylxylan esterase [Arthrobacter jiangjiafuii]QWC10764.1 acetylxylan esterase [Arthrobacter jiangjiafuii]
MYTDLPADQLTAYRGSTTAPQDLDRFWSETLEEARRHPLAVDVTPYPSGLRTVELYDVVFPGFGGDPIRAWLRLPARSTRADPDSPLPGVVQYVGYGGGRGDAHENLFWASAGYAHLQMDTRGQGASWSKGETPDAAGSGGPQVPGMMTRGVLDPQTYYYRRLITDAVRAVDAMRGLATVDPARVAVLGMSQGGGLALAAAALCPEVAAAVAFVPFLSDFPRAVTVTDAYPYREIADYLTIQRGQAETVMATLAYFDTVNLVPQATAPALFSVGLMDLTTPPSTVYAAYNNYGGPKELTVWPFNGHEAGAIEDELAALAFLQRQLAG